MVRLNIVDSEQKWMDFLIDESEFGTKISQFEEETLIQYTEQIEIHEICRICMNDVDLRPNFNEMSVYLLPKKVTNSFLNIREYHSNREIPEKMCKKCMEDLQMAFQVIETCENMQIFEVEHHKCLICRTDCTSKHHNGIKELTSLILTLIDVPDQETVDRIRNARYCDACVESLRIAKEFRYKSYKSEEVFKLQFEEYLKVPNHEISLHDDSTMKIEYLEEEIIEIAYEPDFDPDFEIKDAYYAPPIADDSESDDDDNFFSIRLNHPPTQKVYKCPKCSVIFTHEPDLLIHFDVLHITNGTVCADCGFSCKNINSLRHHRIRMHYQVFTHLCEICGREFPNKAKYLMHFTTHFDERNVMCQVCSAKFKTQKALALHMRMHTGEKPYKCDTCNKRFSHYSDMKRHTVTHTGDYPYKCGVCHKGN